MIERIKGPINILHELYPIIKCNLPTVVVKIFHCISISLRFVGLVVVLNRNERLREVCKHVTELVVERGLVE